MIRDILAWGALLALGVLIAAQIPAAADTEAQWRNDRLCKHYSEEINEHAVTRGMAPPC